MSRLCREKVTFSICGFWKTSHTCRSHHSLTSEDLATGSVEHTDVNVNTLQPSELRSHGFGRIDVSTPFTGTLIHYSRPVDTGKRRLVHELDPRAFFMGRNLRTFPVRFSQNSVQNSTPDVVARSSQQFQTKASMTPGGCAKPCPLFFSSLESHASIAPEKCAKPCRTRDPAHATTPFLHILPRGLYAGDQLIDPSCPPVVVGVSWSPSFDCSCQSQTLKLEPAQRRKFQRIYTIGWELVDHILDCTRDFEEQNRIDLRRVHWSCEEVGVLVAGRDLTE